ncbi:MAG: hypothetical protein KatS3mg097_105 [Candidatus Parcubacteria bacterium]|nr:MAG: hypothetical protein KatS3mg097_105 [Candidatus Parcubacteria bacterium]
MKNIRHFFIITVGILIMLGLIVVNEAYIKAKKNLQFPYDQDFFKKIAQSDNSLTLTLYSDLECPFCALMHITIKQLISAYPYKIKIIFKHLPIDRIHKNARFAAEASECVKEQGGEEAFWLFVDKLFENQAYLSSNLYFNIVSELHLNLDDFKKCFNERRYKNKVEQDYQEGLQKGVRRTPTLIINNKEVISGFILFTDLKEKLDKFLK